MKSADLPSWTKAYVPGRSPGAPAELLSARLVSGIVDLLLVAVVIFTLVAIAQPAPLPVASKVTLVVGGVLLVVLRRLVRSGRGRQAGIALCVIGWIAIAVDVPLHGQQTVAAGGFVVLVVIGGLAVGPYAAIALAGATVVLMAVVLLGLVPVTPIPVPGGGFRLTHYATQLSLAATLVAWWASHMRALLVQVRTSEARYAKLLEALPDAVVRVDPSGTVTFCNSAVQRILGYAPEDLVGRGWDAGPLIAPPRIDALREKFAASMAGSAMPASEVEVSHRDGHVVTMETKGYPLQEDDGRVVGVVAILRDVSERKRAEAERLLLREQLVTAQRMEAIGRFAGGIAHDFNNVLTVILNATDAPGPNGEPVDPTALVDARDAARRGADLTRQLLTFSRRRAPIPAEPTDLAKSATAIGPMLERLLGDAVRVRMDLDASTPRVSMDPGHFDQILVNLVVNARDAMPKGGTIRIGVRALEASAGGGRRVVVEVSDDGAGMSAATKERIFDPFFTTKGDQGTGLGLAVVHGIVQGMGGSIGVESEPGAGTTFRIELPASDGDPESSSSRAPIGSPASA